MSAASEPKPQLATSIGNASVMLALAGACAYGYVASGISAYAVLAASFLLRAPVSFHHPRTWKRLLAELKEPINKPFVSHGSFSLLDSVLSIFGFVLFTVGIGMYVMSVVNGWRGGV